VTTAPRALTPSVNSWNADFLDAEYARFKEDPRSVPADLQAFFAGFDLGLNGLGGAAAAALPAAGTVGGDVRFIGGVENLIEAYRTFGHLGAKLDPFNRERPRPAELELASHGLTQADLDRPIPEGAARLGAGGTLRDLVSFLEQTYCRTIGFELMHARTAEERQFLVDWVESRRGRIDLNPEQRRHILEQLLKAEEFESFLGKRYPGDKRFSLEGSESAIPLLDRMIAGAGQLGAEEAVIGMAHRGRLTVLNTIMGKTYEQIFTEFEDNYETNNDGGDVKYHAGYSGKRVFGGKEMQLALASNPSHLEAVNPIVEGRVRAKQRLRADFERKRVIPILIHGDAAIIGQGVNQEVLNYSQLEGYTTGGTLHVVINNLIGFTTPPEEGRTSTYCTDIGKMIYAPVLHVNGEDPEAVVACAQLAAEYRQRFRKDIFIDLHCFRKYGHNEQDEATFTQPLLYAMIRKKNSVLKVYAERLLAEGAITETDMQAIRKRLDEALEAAQRAAKQQPYDPSIEAGSARWKGLNGQWSFDPIKTSVPMSMLEEVCGALGRIPAGFNLNPKLKALFESRANLTKTKQISYADAESLAIGTLLLEGTAVRISGQDACRGTFSHRHAVVRDQQTGEAYMPLNNIRETGQPGTDAPPGSPGADGRPRQARFCIYNSPLSEYGVVGFEYGYSLADPNMLICWEAQFGDFANTAQVIIDQFISSAEVKWERWSGLVMLLPHGGEGLGPEHSAARLERFLQLCGNDCMQVCAPTTGAQIFHLLRRQVRRNFRKPLIVMAPKSLLRTNTSTIDELVNGTFQEFLDDPAVVSGQIDRKQVKRVMLCSGKIYFDLLDRREKLGRKDTALVRVEQFYPFHQEAMTGILAAYPKGVELSWAQEEPRNYGAFLFMDDILRTTLGIDRLMYFGRETSASPAAGSKTVHKYQQESILSRAMGPLSDAKGKAEAKPQPARV
jgi:2-oxoglutarate dehydrogenase E1 component